MDLSRQEYPALLTSLQPHQAVAVLNERVKLIGKINNDIADWLLERRKVEEAYVLGLLKLAGRRPQEVSSDLGIFRTPWQSIVSSTESLAQSHTTLAQNIEADVERPLREYNAKNREMQAMSTIQGNLTSMAKDVENTQKKVERLKERSGKSAAGKVADANSEVENANQQWDSQAPYVFEQLQALDESRVNHLRDVLTQFQTHEVDQVERNRVAAESCLNVLLNVDTADEISTFVARTTGGRRSVTPRNQNRSTTGNNVLAQVRSRAAQDGASEMSSTSAGAARPDSAQEQRHGGLGGLKRLGTVIGRRRGSNKPTERPVSPDKRSRSTRNPLRRGPSSKNMQAIPSPEASMTNLPSLPPPQLSSIPSSNVPKPTNGSRSPLEQRHIDDQLNGDTIEPAPLRSSTSPTTNGYQAHRDLAQLLEKQSETLSEEPQEIQRDAEGFNVPSSAIDDISRAQQEATASDANSPQLKLDIRNEPIREEDGDAQTALSNVANTLRAQAQQTATPRKGGNMRGRRDVRNTIFVPTPQTPESPALTDPSAMVASPSYVAAPIADNPGSDAQSIQSSHSLSSLTSNAVRHPEMHQPGLNASVVETVSTWFSQGQVTKAFVIGELALTHNATELASSSGTESIRLENFPVLEKVAPNPTFITQAPSRSGEYVVSLSNLARPAVAFKYQVHLEESNLAAHAPIALTPIWKIEAKQISVMLNYSFNPAFASALKRSVSLRNVGILIHIDDAKTISCQSKPIGTFSKEKSLIYWRLGDITLDGYAEAPQKLLARFSTESEAKQGSVEARWEISGEPATGLGSGLSLSQMGNAKEEGTDPFADESAMASPNWVWKDVPVARKLISGKYLAS